MPVLLTRHAHAGSRKAWKGDDRSRPLSDKGRRQAAGLVSALDGWGVQRVLSSPYRRCVQTVEPLARELGIRVELAYELSESHGPEALELVRSLASDKVAMCTHGDVIPDVLVPLADEDRLDLGPQPGQAKGSVWVLEADGARFFRASYLPPVEKPAR
jgi:broad specificity phosphatase PhoE